MKKFLYLLGIPVFLVSCGTGTPPGNRGDFADNRGLTEEPLDAGAAPRQLARSEHQDLLFGGPRYYIGSPFTIDNVQHTPVENWNYSETGIAGIVPIELNGATTTNGERFDTSAMQATSKVLPLPSIVRVTNLSNGQTAVVRVNNRGPFVNTRLMDVSPAAARQLGMTGQTRVRVELLEPESRRVRDLSIANQGGLPATPAPAPTPAPAEPVAIAPAMQTFVAPQPQQPVQHAFGTGNFTVQAGAFHSEQGARTMASQVSNVGHATVELEDGMWKVQMRGLDQDSAREAIRRLRSEHGLAPGLLNNGRWINANSI